KKKILSRRIGPPSVPPYWFCLYGGFGLPLLKNIVRIELLVAKKLEQGSVQLVGPGLRGHLHHRASAPAELRAVIVGVHLEFLDSVDGRFDGLVGSDHDAAEIVVVVAA